MNIDFKNGESYVMKAPITWSNVVISCTLTLTLGQVWYIAFDPFVAFFISIASATFTTYMFTEAVHYWHKRQHKKWKQENPELVKQLQEIFNLTLIDGEDNARHDRDIGAGNSSKESDAQSSKEAE